MKNNIERRMLPTRLLTIGALAFLLAGCADMAGVPPPQAKMRDAASLGLAGAAAQPALSAEWWRTFGDPQLDALVDRALQDSPSLKLAQARLERARAMSEGARSALLPKLGAELDLNRQLFTANSIYPPPLGGAIYNSGQAQLEGSWEIDFFGKNRAALDAALGNTLAAEADAQAARVLLASNVARGYFQLARLHDQLAVAERTLAQREQELGLVRDRFDAGLDTTLELRESEGGLPDARRQIEALAEQITLQRNALGALVGQPDAAKTLTPPALTAIKSVAMAQAVPANLLGRRADVAAARWRVEAASEDVKNAKRQFYPNVNLVALAGFSSLGFGNLFKSGSAQWNVGPAITLPIFEGGRLRANLHGKNADLDAAVESYNATVLDAVRDAADQIASLQSIARQQTQQSQARAAAESAYDISLQRYKAGLGTYLNVLTAESTVLAQRRLEVDLRARALDTQVALIHALGGGYPAEAVAQADAKAAPERVASRP
ncbi:MAG: efflux transporter outer membrane subunit [Proteobacteria bacterium]|nr:efflux transporter outer membrane subunit [Pseudomonadota bacterium]